MKRPPDRKRLLFSALLLAAAVFGAAAPAQHGEARMPMHTTFQPGR